mmetsp:Transcript_20993/g.59056  ORF Transcript_20993/g.59056 Transcript_20993/m.59056 type:complete len:487 (+) Transcript_20993:116-1576(+)
MAGEHVIHEEVEKFIVFFHNHVKDRNTQQIQMVYEVSFPKLTDRYYKSSHWPSVGAIASLVNNDQVFLLLYRELYFRHIYARLQPTLQQRIESWENYSNLFSYLLRKDGAVPVEIPMVWLWDMLDEFVFQYQSFHQYRGKVKARTAEERQVLKANPRVWDTGMVMRQLAVAMERSDILKILHSSKHEADETNFDMVRTLGYFALVSMARLHVLLGDYHTALSVLDDIDMSRKGLHQRVPACQVSLHYYVGVSYLMSQRIKDAIRTFTNILVHINRSKNFQARTNHFDQVVRMCDKILALTAIAVTLSPQRVDETIENAFREKLSEKFGRIQQWQLSAFEEMFMMAAPKFVTPCSSLYPDNTNYAQEGLIQQTKVLMGMVKQYSIIPTLRSFLVMYTTLPISKLATLLDMSESAVTAELMNWKSKTNELQCQGIGSLTDGSRHGTCDVKYYIENEMIHISVQKSNRRQADYFISHITKLEALAASAN